MDIVGGGMRLLDEVPRQRLELVRSTSYTSGTLSVAYRVARS